MQGFSNMNFLIVLLFALIKLSSSSLIPRGFSNVLKRFPLKNDRIVALSPKRMMTNMANTEKSAAKRRGFINGLIAGTSISAAAILYHEYGEERDLIRMSKFIPAKEVSDPQTTAHARCFAAITTSNFREFEMFCASKSFDINSRDKDGVTAMEVAIKHGKSQFILPLLRAGVHKNGRDSQGHRYLQTAIETGNDDILGELLFRGFDVHAIGQVGRDHFQRAIETGNVDMIRSWIFAGIDANGRDSKNRHFIVTAVLNHQRGSFDALLDTKFKRPWDFQVKEVLMSIMEESRKATPEEAGKMNYPEMIARLYVQCKCDHELYEFLKSKGLAKDDLAFLKRIEPISCRKDYVRS